MATLRSRLKRGWNAFLGRDAPEVFNASYDEGPSYSLGGYKIQSYGWNKSSATSIIKNKIANFKYKELTNYHDLTYYLNSGFTIILYSSNLFIAFFLFFFYIFYNFILIFNSFLNIIVQIL